MKKIIGLIPCRLNSKRLKNKALIKINNYPLIVHTYKRANLSKLLNELYVCTDSDEIIHQLKKFDCKYIKTKSNFINGTERIASVCQTFDSKLFLDIQGDEPLINPNDIDNVIKFHLRNLKKFDIVLPFQEIKKINSKNIVKLLAHQNKVYFMTRSSSPFPFKENNFYYKKHLSIISFTKAALIKFSKSKPSFYEKIEGIELLRAIENNLRVGTFKSSSSSFSVDIKEDLNRVIKFMINDKIQKRY
jgi:3-deoxy-manno-octulosonate cytidylyltransferase (CMP-KDO synthetase)